MYYLQSVSRWWVDGYRNLPEYIVAVPELNCHFNVIVGFTKLIISLLIHLMCVTTGGSRVVICFHKFPNVKMDNCDNAICARVEEATETFSLCMYRYIFSHGARAAMV